jgi:hypothetical protein
MWVCGPRPGGHTVHSPVADRPTGIAARPATGHRSFPGPGTPGEPARGRRRLIACPVGRGKHLGGGGTAGWRITSGRCRAALPGRGPTHPTRGAQQRAPGPLPVEPEVPMRTGYHLTVRGHLAQKPRLLDPPGRVRGRGDQPRLGGSVGRADSASRVPAEGRSGVVRAAWCGRVVTRTPRLAGTGRGVRRVVHAVVSVVPRRVPPRPRRAVPGRPGAATGRRARRVGRSSRCG